MTAETSARVPITQRTFLSLVDANTPRYWVLIVLAVVVGVLVGSVLGGVPGAVAGVVGFVLALLVLLAVCDVFNYYVGRSFFDTEAVIRHGYNLSLALNDSPHSVGLDYGFNLYDGDYERDRATAQEAKFRYAWDQLGLRSGSRLLDVGCGCGDWLAWCRDQGAEVVGINISDGQVDECRSRGLDVVAANWKDVPGDPALMAKLGGAFDVVTYWDTVEHYVPSRFRNDFDSKAAIYDAMFEFTESCLDPAGPGRVWISCLHLREEVASRPAREQFYMYLLDKFHSGCYPNHARNELVEAARRTGFALTLRRDTTADYFMTSVLEPSHFGRHRHEGSWNRRLLLAWNTVVDPNWAQRLMWFRMETWMNQFDPDDIDGSDMVHWWLRFERSTA